MFWLHDKLFDIMTYFWFHDKILTSWQHFGTFWSNDELFEVITNLLSSWRVFDIFTNFLTPWRVYDIMTNFWFDKHSDVKTCMLHVLTLWNFWMTWDTFWRHDAVFDVRRTFYVVVYFFTSWRTLCCHDVFMTTWPAFCCFDIFCLIILWLKYNENMMLML